MSFEGAGGVRAASGSCALKRPDPNQFLTKRSNQLGCRGFNLLTRFQIRSQSVAVTNSHVRDFNNGFVRKSVEQSLCIWQFGSDIQPDNGGKDVFVHISAVERAGLSSLNEGAKVSYEETENRGKTSAENLRVG